MNKNIILIILVLIYILIVSFGVYCYTTSNIARLKTENDSLKMDLNCSYNDLGEIDDSNDYVDLGLSVKWSKYNLGADKIIGFGQYYVWGETSRKDIYDEDVSFSSSIEGSQYDIARVKLGSKWRLPTKSEWKELRTNCEWDVVKCDGVYGYMVTSNMEGYQGNSIFLPATGCKEMDGVVYWVGKMAYYMCSDLHYCTFSIDTRSSYFNRNCGLQYVSDDNRKRYMNVRPVYSSVKKDVIKKRETDNMYNDFNDSYTASSEETSVKKQTPESNAKKQTSEPKHIDQVIIPESNLLR